MAKNKSKLVDPVSREAQRAAGVGLYELEKESPRLFMGMVHHKTTKGERMTFADKMWLVPIYKDASKEMVVIKCSQVHMTEHALCAMFTFANQGKRGMYILPSKEHRKTFVKDRIDRMKDYSDVYANAIKQTGDESENNVYKNIYGTGWKFVGANVRKDFFEFPCEVLFFDEYDQLDQENVLYAYDRVADVAAPYIWKFGNPTRDNFGIHKEWLKSDQKEWHVECEHCKHMQVLDWYTHFVKETTAGKYALRNGGFPICINCAKPFDRLGKGKWIALNPESKVSGYRITRLFVNKKRPEGDIQFLFAKFTESLDDPSALQNFHNNYLAITYENRDFSITMELLEKVAQKKFIDGYNPSTMRAIMGTDQGKNFTCVISLVLDGEIYDVGAISVLRWADVEALENTFNVIFHVVDAQGGGYAETRDFVAAKGSRFMCYYRPKDQVKSQYNLKYEEQLIEVNRTEMADAMVKGLKRGTTHPMQNFKTVANGDYLKQMMVPARIIDAGGRPVWTKGTDHFFHASLYRHVALIASGMKNSVVQIKEWKSKVNLQGKRPEPKAGTIGIVDEPIAVTVAKPTIKKLWRR